MNDAVFCIGRCSAGSVGNKIRLMKLNDTNLKRNNVLLMNEKRCFIGAAVFRDYFVVAGGEKFEDIFGSIEYFNGPSGKWVLSRSSRKEFCLVECDDSLFAFGGNNEAECLSCVERLQSLNGR